MIIKSSVYSTTSIKIAVLLSSIILLGSCIKKEKFDKFEVDPLDQGWGLPIIDSKLSLRDIVSTLKNNKNLTENLEDNSYTFTYYDTLTTVTADKLVVLPSQQISKDISVGIGLPKFSASDAPINQSFDGIEIISFAPNTQLKSILFKEGALNVEFSSTLKHSVTATVTIPSLKSSTGSIYTHVFNVPFSNGSSAPASLDNINLNGYTLDLKGAGATTNTILYNVSYKISGSGQPIFPTDKMSLNLGFSGLKFKNMIGNFSGLVLAPYSGSTDIKVFDNALEGDVSFDRATVVFNVDNSFGIPMDLAVDSMETQTAYKNKDVRVISEPNNIKAGQGILKISAPALSSVGSKALTTFTFDNQNSNISEMIKPAPNKLKYVLAPKFTSSSTDQFITDMSMMQIRVKVIIPIYGILRFYQLGDTLAIEKFPVRSGEYWTLDSVRFTFKTTNSLPVDANTQLYFLDSLGNRIDSLLNNPNSFIRRPLINNQGKSIEEAEQTTKIYMGGKRYDKIMAKAKNIYLKCTVLTSEESNKEQPNIQLFSYNYLRIQICGLAIGQARPKLQ